MPIIPPGNGVAAIEAEGRAKTCLGRSVALGGVSFTVGRGEVFGLLGPDARARLASTGLHWMGVRPYDDGQTPILALVEPIWRHW